MIYVVYEVSHDEIKAIHSVHNSYECAKLKAWSLVQDKDGSLWNGSIVNENEYQLECSAKYITYVVKGFECES